MKKFSQINERKMTGIELEIEDLILHIVDEHNLICYVKDDGSDIYNGNWTELWREIPKRYKAAYRITKIKSVDKIWNQKYQEVKIEINSSIDIKDIGEQVREILEYFGWYVKCIGVDRLNIVAIKKKS
jgi:hypothetical protein